MNTSVTPLAELEEHEPTVAVRHVETPKGERLELGLPDRTAAVRFDAILLEWVTDQDEATFRDLRAYGPGRSDASLVATSTVDGTTREALTTITNEFAHVDVSTVATPEADLLGLVAPKRDTSIYLNGAALETLTYPSMDTFSGLLRDQIQ